MIVLDPSALTAYVITADGAIAADGSYEAGTLDEAQLVNMGSDWFDGSSIVPPEDPAPAGDNGFEGAIYATFHAPSLKLYVDAKTSFSQISFSLP